jgi:hypothetical protein
MLDAPDAITLEAARLTAIVDLVLYDDQAVPVLVLADGAACVSLPCVNKRAAIEAARRIATATRELIEELEES